MNSFYFFIRTLFKRKWWVLGASVLAAVIAILIVSRIPDKFKSNTVIYTGIVSGYDMVSMSSSRSDLVYVNSTIDNLLTIIKSQPTLEMVSIKLLAQDLMNLDPDNDNEYLTARSSRDLIEKVPVEVMKIVDMDSFDNTVNNLRAYASQNTYNFVYGIFHWSDPHYSFKALSNIEASRVESSDMLEMSYINDDPYIVYNTLKFLNEEFVNQYNELRFQQTNKVIAYFMAELERKGKDLNQQEDVLRNYNVSHLVINYDEQTRIIAEREGLLSDKYDQALTTYRGAVAVRESLEEKLDQIQVYKNNAQFLDKLRSVSSLYSSITASSIDISGDGNADEKAKEANAARQKLIDQRTEELHEIMNNISNQKYSKEGLLTTDILDQWFDAILNESKSKAELDVLDAAVADLRKQFVRFSPIGTELGRDNRSISFTERSYLNTLEALNEAILRQKNLEMTSATFKVMTPPAVALMAEPSKNSMIVVLAFLLTLIFVTTIFIIVEIFNRKPEDKWQVNKLISKNVLGSYPNESSSYFEIARDNALQQLGNAIVNNFDRSKERNIVNIFSTVEGVGKSTVMEALKHQLETIGMKPYAISWNKDFNAESKEFIMSFSIFDFVSAADDPESLVDSDVILIEYPPVSKVNIPQRLMKDCAANIVVVDSAISWTEMDQMLFKQLSLKASPEPQVLINRATTDVVGTFTGMLPPYTMLHKLNFNLNNIGVKASE